MPHIVIEHSAGLQDSHDLQALCDVIWQGFADHPSVKGPDTVRVRCIAATASRIGVDPQSFAHATVLLLTGRSDHHGCVAGGAAGCGQPDGAADGSEPTLPEADALIR